MNNSEFNEWDKQLSKKLTPSQPKIPEDIRKNFSRDVEAKIGESAGPRVMYGLVPGILFASAAVFLVVWFLNRGDAPVMPENSYVETVTQEPEEQMKEPVTDEPAADVLDEIAMLRDLGVWTDQDELNIGIALDDQLAEIELAFDEKVPAVKTAPVPRL